MAFPLHATLTDAVEFLRQASRDYAKPETPLQQRGVNFELRLSPAPQQRDLVPGDPFAFTVETNLVHAMFAAMSIRSISLYDALQLVCDVTDMSWGIEEDGKVVIAKRGCIHLTRTYNIPTDLSYDIFIGNTIQASDLDSNKIWQDFFKQLGVMEPSFAKVEHLSSIGKLLVTNTPENLAIIESIFSRFSKHMVEVEVQIHAFRTVDIERLRLSGGVSRESLMALRQNGKAKPVASATALTKPGQEALVKAVQEVIYPTELNMDIDQTGSNVTTRSVANALIPSDTTMRETGMILQVVPEVSTDKSQINLTLKPQWVTLEGWESYPAAMASGWMHTALSIKQPIFEVTSFETSVRINDGGTVLLGICSAPDGEWVNVGFLTVRLKNEQPLYEGACTKGTKAQDEQKDQEVMKKLQAIVIPEMTFRTPATIFDVIRFIKEASIQYDKEKISEAQRGVNFVLILPRHFLKHTASSTDGDPFAITYYGAPVIPAISVRLINLYDVLNIVREVTGMEFRISNGVVWIKPHHNPDDRLITRRYFLDKLLCERMNKESNNFKQDWEKFFGQFGVAWAAGSSISYLPSIGMLRVTNTPENLAVFEAVIDDTDYVSCMVEVDVQIHAFPTEEIEQVRLSGDMSVEALMGLRKAGKSKQIASATAVTRTGQEAIVRAVREIIYPTELLTDCGQEGSHGFTPSNFTTRDVGMTLQVVPEIVPSGLPLINLTMKPQWVTLDRWEAYPSKLAAGWAHKTLSLRQPVFGMTSYETQTVVEAGKTVLLGSSSTPDGKWVNVGFLTVKECR
jgi:Flp pilus assembly secretin CpaC